MKTKVGVMGSAAAESARLETTVILFLHIKDVVSPFTPPQGEARPYEFVELGRGQVDLPNVFAALDRAGYKGWAIIELDRVYGRTPKEAAAISKQFVEKTLKRKV